MSEKDPRTLEWVVDQGSIYVAKEHGIRSEFPAQKRTIMVRTAIAFNIGQTLAEHIVKVHNERLGMNQFVEFLDGNPERFKLHDYGPRGTTPISEAVGTFIGGVEGPSEIEFYKKI